MFRLGYAEIEDLYELRPYGSFCAMMTSHNDTYHVTNTITILTTGHKRCKSCNVFIKWRGFFCPSCGYKAITRPTKVKLQPEKRVDMTINCDSNTHTLSNYS